MRLFNIDNSERRVVRLKTSRPHSVVIVFAADGGAGEVIASGSAEKEGRERIIGINNAHKAG